MSKNKILLVYTGGTVGGMRDASDNITDDLAPKAFLKEIKAKAPHWENIVEFDIVTPAKKFSEDFIPSDWISISKAISEETAKEEYRGVVVLHGTDTMSYSAAALSFIDHGINIPICFTGSNYPIQDEGTDAARNFLDALHVALVSELPGVFLVFSGEENKNSLIHMGNRVRKVRFAQNCYESVNASIIGEVTTGGLMRPGKKIKYTMARDHVKALTTDQRFTPHHSDRIGFYKIYPGFRPDRIVADIRAQGLLGIILELYNSGTGCIEGNKYSLLPALEYAREMNVPVFATSQHAGSVKMDTYISSLEMVRRGVVPLRDMITEAAMPKLMLTLRHTKEYTEIVNKMTTNIAGEMSDKT